MGILFWNLFHSGAAALGPNNCWSTPHHPKIYHRDHIERIPLKCQNWVVLHRHVVVLVECIHTVLLQKMVYRQNTTWRQIHRPIHASQMPDGLLPASKLKFQYLHRSQFWVFCTLHLSGAGWSRVPWGVLPAACGVTIPDGPASADLLSTGGAGVEVSLFSTPAMGCILLILPYVGVDGKQIVPM